MIKISVVIPAKNRAHTLPACIESILAQTYQPGEIIVVDDHSTDGTKDVVESYIKSGVRYEFLSEGVGAQAARNWGVRSAKYDWIAFQDSDDRWLPEKLDVQVDVLRDCAVSELVLIHSDGIRVDVENNAESLISNALMEGDCYKMLLIRSGPMFQSFLVNKFALESIGMLDENCPSYQEWDTALRLAKVCRFVHVRKPLFKWMCHGGETISKDLMRDIDGFMYVLNKNKDEILLVHGRSSWLSLVASVVDRTLRFGFYSKALEISKNELPFHVRVLVSLFDKINYCPPYVRRLLRVLAKFSF